MKKIINLKESDLQRIIKTTLNGDNRLSESDYPLPSKEEFSQKKRDIQQMVRVVNQIVETTQYSEDGVTDIWELEYILYDTLQDYLY